MKTVAKFYRDKLMDLYRAEKYVFADVFAEALCFAVWSADQLQDGIVRGGLD